MVAASTCVRHSDYSLSIFITSFRDEKYLRDGLFYLR